MKKFFFFWTFLAVFTSAEALFVEAKGAFAANGTTVTDKGANAAGPDKPGHQNNSLDPPKIIRPITEFYDDAHRGFQSVSALCVSSDSRVWAAWYAGGMNEGEDNYILLSTSGDGGQTWSVPLFAVDPNPPTRAFDEMLWTDPNGRVHLFWTQSDQGVWDGRSGVWEMTTDDPENGETSIWTEPRRIADGVMVTKPIVDSKGRWLYPVQIFRSRGKYSVPEERWGATVHVSTDGGKTLDFFSAGSPAPEEIRGADEHNLVEKKDGSLWIFSRLKVPGIGESHSLDGGKTWSKFRLTGINHAVSRFFIRRLASGNLLLVKNGAIDEYCGRSRMMAFLSEDDGQTWIGGLMLDPRFRVSYPDGDQAPDGTIYVTYDRNRGLEREIYCAKFTEDDVRAGKILSPQGRLQIIINKPTDEFNAWWEGAFRYPKENGMPGDYWDTEKALEVIQEIERGEHPPIKNF